MKSSPVQSVLRQLIAATLLAGTAVAAQASVITFDTRYTTAGLQGSADAYRNLVEGLTAAAPTAGYCSTAVTAWNGLSNHATCGGPSSYSAFDITASFGVTASQAGSWSFRVGPDFGMGGALFLDGVALAYKADDLWWNGSYANPSETLTATVNLTAGNHVLEAYGLEHCCDGSQQAQFKAAGSNTWVTFSNTDGQPVPEPGSLALAALGLAGLLGSRRRFAAGRK